jgi:hypothetical protein
MKTLRHRLGRWLLRDAPKPEVKIVGFDAGSAEAILRVLRAHKRRNGGGDLGLS